MQHRGPISGVCCRQRKSSVQRGVGPLPLPCSPVRKHQIQVGPLRPIPHGRGGRDGGPCSPRTARAWCPWRSIGRDCWRARWTGAPDGCSPARKWWRQRGRGHRWQAHFSCCFSLVVKGQRRLPVLRAQLTVWAWEQMSSWGALSKFEPCTLFDPTAEENTTRKERATLVTHEQWWRKSRWQGTWWRCRWCWSSARGP